jgi:plastocyanin
MRLCLILVLLWDSPAGGTVSGKVSAPEGAAQKRLRAKLYGNDAVAGRKDPDPALAVVWLEGVAAPAKVDPRTAVIRQEGLEFRPRALAVTVGSKVDFPNDDDLFHNVFSFSRSNRIELGSYPKGESKSVVVDKKGLVDLRCEVHKHMRAFIHVFDHPYFAVAGADGAWSIPNVPPGKYTLVVWKEFFDPVRRDVEVTAEGATVDVTLSALLDRPADRTVGAACCDAR